MKLSVVKTFFFSFREYIKSTQNRKYERKILIRRRASGGEKQKQQIKQTYS